MTSIRLNGKEILVEGDTLSYEQVVLLAYGSYQEGLVTIVYSAEEAFGSLIPGEVVYIQSDMRISAVKTGSA